MINKETEYIDRSSLHPVVWGEDGMEKLVLPGYSKKLTGKEKKCLTLHFTAMIQ